MNENMVGIKIPSILEKVGKIRTLPPYLQPKFGMNTALPSEFINSMNNLLPDSELKSFVHVMNGKSPVSLRRHPIKGEGLFSKQESVPWCSEGAYLEERPRFALDPAFHNGSYYVQEAASMFLEHVFHSIKLPSSPFILDLCAAPGGKSTHLLSLLSGRGFLLSNEVVKSRLKVLNENITKWGFPNVITTNNDPEQFGRFPALFDCILVDAPCSGEGMFRKDERARSEWSENNVQHCHLRQRRILNDVWPALKEGGYLIYSTCTFNQLENEKSVKELVQNGMAESIELNVPWKEIDHREDEGVNSYRFWPQRTKSEGFFVSVLQKTQKEAPKKGKQTKLPFEPITFRSDLLLHSEPLEILRTEKGKQFILPINTKEWVAFIVQNFRVGLVGLELALEKGKDLRWSHSFAMSTIMNPQAFNSIDLQKEDALNFLRRKWSSPPPNKSKWVLATYNHQPLGWLKQAGERWNNCYPQDWRLRLE